MIAGATAPASQLAVRAACYDLSVPSIAEPKPILQELFEAASAALELDEGPHALVLGFVAGRLIYWSTGGRDDRRPPAELAAVDARVSWLVDVRDPRSRLEAAVAEACRRAGLALTGREAEIRIRVDAGGRVRWVEPLLLRVPASALE
jgi:hypothetical protein